MTTKKAALAGAIDLTPVKHWIEGLRQAKAEAEKWEGIVRTCRAAIENHLQVHGDATAGHLDGQLLVTWKPSKPGTYTDLEALTADHPDIDLDKYKRERKPTRPFKLLEPK
jgi:hypothetical protein